MTWTLVLGGARSGKSAYAQAAAERGVRRPVMIATAQEGDAEMAERIARHRAGRDPRWRTLEAPLDLAGALSRIDRSEPAVIDCLTLWVSNLIHAEMDIPAQTERLIQAMGGHEVILVANEVGLGIVPDNALARRFRDEAGRLNQRIAAAADNVVFLAAGLPLVLKGVAPVMAKRDPRHGHP